MSVKEKVDAAFEEFREYLVSLLGDHHGVHSTVDDAKAAIQAHVPDEEPATQDASTAVASTDVVVEDPLPHQDPKPAE